MDLAAIDLGTRHLRAVVTLARFGSFVAAAAELSVSQPSLTRTIRSAEEALGVALFTRSTRQVALTPAGREFVALAERLLGEMAVGIRDMYELAGRRLGQLVVSSLMSVAQGVLPGAIRDFRAARPWIGLHLREGLQSAVHEDVRAGVVDFGLGDVADVLGALEAVPLGRLRFDAVLPRGHALAHRRRLCLADLAKETLVSMPADAGVRRIIDAAALSSGVTVAPAVTVRQYNSVLALVAAGVGVAIVPAVLLAGRADPRLVARPLHAPPVVQRIGLIRRRDRPLSEDGRVFLDCLARSLDALDLR